MGILHILSMLGLFALGIIILLVCLITAGFGLKQLTENIIEKTINKKLIL